MTTETPAPTEPVAEPVKVTAPVVETEVPEEAFDKERALRTIHAQREEMKEAKAQLKELATLKAEAAKRAEAEMTEAERLNHRHHAGPRNLMSSLFPNHGSNTTEPVVRRASRSICACAASFSAYR